MWKGAGDALVGDISHALGLTKVVKASLGETHVSLRRYQLDHKEMYCQQIDKKHNEPKQIDGMHVAASTQRSVCNAFCTLKTEDGGMHSVKIIRSDDTAAADCITLDKPHMLVVA